MNASAISGSSSKEYRPVGLHRMIPLFALVFFVASSALMIFLIFATPEIDTAGHIVNGIGALILLLLGILL